MKKFILYIALFCISFSTKAQLGFNPQTGFVFFNSPSTYSISNYSPFAMPYTLPSQLEGYAQLNDSCLNTPVIFSTNGIDVFNGATGAVVASGLLGQTNSTNAATIVPISGNRALIITTKNWSSTTNEAYTSILNYTTGVGCSPYSFSMPIATKNIQLIGIGGETNMSEKVTVIPVAGASGDKWLIMHEASNTATGKFLVFRINNTTGVTNAISSYNVGLPIQKIGGKGQMQAVPAQVPSIPSPYFIGAAYLRRPSAWGGATDILVFNSVTGAITLKETMLHGSLRPYGLEFSRGSVALYLAFRNAWKTIFRYDPYAGGAIASSLTPSSYGASIPNRRFGQLQCLDNDAIFTPLWNSNNLLYIPNSNNFVSFPLAPPSILATAPATTIFRFGLPNYWRN
jgi:hypothetical protein